MNTVAKHLTHFRTNFGTRWLMFFKPIVFIGSYLLSNSLKKGKLAAMGLQYEFFHRYLFLSVLSSYRLKIELWVFMCLTCIKIFPTEKLLWNNFHITTLSTLPAHNSVQAGERCPVKITLLQRLCSATHYVQSLIKLFEKYLHRS